jgi:hypothetical protein
MEKLSVRELEVKGRRVLVRVDRPRPFSGTAQLGFLKFQISQPALESSPKLSRRQVRKPSLEAGIQ